MEYLRLSIAVLGTLICLPETLEETSSAVSLSDHRCGPAGAQRFFGRCYGQPAFGSVPTTPDPNTSAKVS